MRLTLRRWQHFVRFWLQSRIWVDLAWGLPALIVASAATAILLYALCHRTPESETDRYLRAAREAVHKKEWKAADLYYEKVLQHVPHHSTAVFELAKVASVRRQTARRDSLLQRLKSTENDPRKHLWIAELLAESISTKDPIGEAVHHLELAEDHGLDGQALRRNLALRAYHQQHFGTAISLLEKDYSKSPVRFLILAQSHQQLGQLDQAQRAARRLLQAADYEELTASARQLYHAQAHTVLGNYPQAIDLLERQRHSQNRKAIEPYLAEIYASWLKDLKTTSAALAPSHITLLERGLSLSPKHPALVEAFLKLVHEAPNTVLDEAFGRITSPTITHLAFGVRALQKGKSNQAAFHFDLAQQSHPAAHVILNACTRYNSQIQLTPEMLASVGVAGEDAGAR